MNILGIGGVLGDAAAAVIRDAQIAGAVEEAKLTRRPQPGRLPEAAVAACLRMAGLENADVDYVALARPLPPGSALPIALRMFPKARVVSIDHHAAHAAAAYLASPFQDASVITLDREGDLRCGSKWRGEANRLTLEDEILYPDSIGELYGRVTELLGFQRRADEHRVQWLSATGTPRYADTFCKIVQGNTIDQTYFDSGRQGHGGFGLKFFEELGLNGQAELKPRERADIAAAMQRALEEYVMRLAGNARNVCLGGGVAWNALLVSAMENSGRFKGVFAQPAAGNAGTALGAALNVWSELPEPEIAAGTRRIDGAGYCFGPSFSAAEIKQVLENCKLRFKLVPTTPEMIGAAVDQLKQNRIVAWMQGRMEFGPRALGNRSILASPQDPYSTENLNAFIKHREAVRKFAASVPAELASEYFEAGANARYLATVSRVREPWKKQFQGAILADDLVRVHTVGREDNPLYWQLLHAFGQNTGLPVLYNTSFNLFGEPLVCTPRDAVRSFYSSGIDAMVVGNFLLGEVMSAGNPQAGPAKVARVGGAAGLVAAGIFLSRIAGLIRDRVFAHYFGNSFAADAFKAALRIPNFLQTLFGEGVLSASFIPVYAGLLGRDTSEAREEAGRVAGAVFAILALLTSVLVLIGVVATPLLIDAIAPFFTGPTRQLTISLVRILFPGAGMLVLSAWCLGILNSHRRFFLSYSVPVLWNLAMIAAMLWYGPNTRQERLAGIVAWASVAGSVAQFLAQLPVVLRLVPALRIHLATHLDNVRVVIRNFVPVFVSRGVVQLSAYIDSIIASGLPTGAVAALAYAQTIYLLPVSLFGMSVSASELPAMSSTAGAGEEIAAGLRRRLVNGLRKIAFFVIPSAVAFIALGDIIAGAIYQTGKFTHTDSVYVWGILAGSGIGLLASTQGRLYSSAFYALKDTRTPLRFAIIRVVLTTVLGYSAAFPLRQFLGIDPKWGVAGLTASAGVSGWIEFLLLRRALARRIGSQPVGAGYLGRLWASAIAAAGVAWLIKLETRPGLHPITIAVFTLVPFGIVYLSLAGWEQVRQRFGSLFRPR